MNLGKNFDPSKYGNGKYTYAEIVYVIKLSSMLCTIEEIQEKFRAFSNGEKSIKGDVILEIQADHSSRIQKEAEIYLKCVDGNPFAHPRLVLDMYLEIYRDARIPRPTQTIKLGQDEWGTVEEADNRTALSAVDSATKYLRENAKLDLEKVKRNQSLMPPTTPVSESSEAQETKEVAEEPTVWKME